MDGDGFGEVAGFVNVATAGDGDVVGEELQGHDGEDGVDGFEGFGDVKDVVGDFGDLVVAFGGDGDDGAFAGADHGEVGHGFVVHGVLGYEEDGGGFGIDEGDGAVFHFGGGVALGVDVGDFLELEGAFEGDGEGVTAAEEEEVVGPGIFEGDFFQRVALGEDGFELFGQGFEGAHDFEGAAGGEHAHAAEVDAKEGEDGECGDEGLGGGDADFGAGVHVDAAIGFAGDGAADDVADGEGAMAAAPGFAEGGKRASLCRWRR